MEVAEGLLHRLLERYAGLDGAALLRPMMEDEFRGELAIVSSFGVESAVLLALAAAVDPAVPVLFLDTGKHFGETLRYRDRLAHHLGLSDVRVLRPDPVHLERADPNGTLWSEAPDSCCTLRKVLPLELALTGFRAWVTGRKRFQGGARQGLPTVEAVRGRIKVNPLATWTQAQIEAEFRARDLPRHPLHADGYDSIACMPCTARTAPGDDPRAGRWPGLAKSECGIHLPLPNLGTVTAQGARVPAGWTFAGVGEVEFEGHLLLAQPGRQVLLVLNETARLIWASWKAGAPPIATARTLAATFHIPPERALGEVEAVLDQWHEWFGPAPVNGGDPRPLPEPAGPTAGMFRTRIYAPCGPPIGIAFGDPDLERAIHPLLAPAVVEVGEPGVVISVRRAGDGSCLVAVDGRAQRIADVEAAIGHVVTHVIDLSYPGVRWLALFHAAAVSVDSRAVLMPGASGAGKSTLTLGLVHAGCSYFSDDVVPLAAGGQIVPVPLALCLKPGSWSVADQHLSDADDTVVDDGMGEPRRYIDVTRIAPVAPRAGLPIAAIVFPRFLPDAKLHAQEMAPLEALERIVGARAWLSLDATDLTSLLHVLRNTRSIHLTYGSLQDAVTFMTRDLLTRMRSVE